MNLTDDAKPLQCFFKYDFSDACSNNAFVHRLSRLMIYMVKKSAVKRTDLDATAFNFLWLQRYSSLRES